ncbi:SPL family radical SAM protein [Paenibacillus gansuensis]|uniref:Radical SAM protein n=1 Tax=Paenibacillus gansuensis TaxID=306542 RepID=A0ABW5PG11_9BACL
MAAKTQYEPMHSKTMLNQVKAPSMPFDWSLNPYRGCQHGCSFCYARATHTFLGEQADDTFQHHIYFKENAAQALREQLAKAARSKQGLAKFGQVAIGTATDPYQQIEAKSRLTRQCLEVLAEYGVPTSITTRSPLILNDLDLLKSMNITSVNISLHSLDSNVWKRFEPSTPSPVKRLETVRTLKEEGLHAGIFMAPVLPHISDSDEELERFARAAKEHKADFVMSSFLRLSTQEVKYWFFETLRAHYPDLVPVYADYYASSHYAPDRYRIPVRKKIHGLLERYGVGAKEPFSGRVQVRDEGNPSLQDHSDSRETPVQLSFSF